MKVNQPYLSSPSRHATASISTLCLLSKPAAGIRYPFLSRRRAPVFGGVGGSAQEADS